MGCYLHRYFLLNSRRWHSRAHSLELFESLKSTINPSTRQPSHVTYSCTNAPELSFTRTHANTHTHRSTRVIASNQIQCALVTIGHWHRNRARATRKNLGADNDCDLQVLWMWDTRPGGEAARPRVRGHLPCSAWVQGQLVVDIGGNEYCITILYYASLSLCLLTIFRHI